jgi:hypothetical protein
VTITEWLQRFEGDREKAARAALLVQLTAARWRAACGDGRWPSLASAVAQLEGLVGVPKEQSFEHWRDAMGRARAVCAEHGWNAAEVRKHGW